MRSHRLLRVALLALVGVAVACLGSSVAAAMLTAAPNPSSTIPPCADFYRSASGDCLTQAPYPKITFVPPTGQPRYTPNATEIANGYFSVAAYPDPDASPLTVVVVGAYIGPSGRGPCDSGPTVQKYEFGDGTAYVEPVPSCGAFAFPDYKTPSPSPLIHWTTDGIRHTYKQPGTYRVRFSGGYVNNHGIMAETTVVVSEPPPPPAANGGEIDPRTLVLVLAGGGVGLLLLVGLAFAIAARERAWQNGEG